MNRTSPRWIDVAGNCLDKTQGLTANNVHIPQSFVDAVAAGQQLANVSMLAFRDPESFIAENLHNHTAVWEHIAEIAPYEQTSLVLDWIRNKVSVFSFFQPYKGQFKGQYYDSDIPPLVVFQNSVSCKPYVKIISDTIVNKLASGAIWAKVGEVVPPHLVMPLTVEPSKPRLCNDKRFLNVWIKDSPFKLDSLATLPRYVSPNSKQSVCDDKSGYDHLLLTSESRTFFGFQWAGWYFVSNTTPFGWKASAYIYHSTGLLSSHYFRSHSIPPCSLYIDDRHTRELCIPFQSSVYENLPILWRSFASVSSAIFILCYTLVALGYFLGLSKSILLPRQAVPYLGFMVDSVKQAFLLLHDKKQKFCDLICLVLGSDSIDLKTLQRLSGKCTSFALAVPGARLFTNEINLANSKPTRFSRPVTLFGPLNVEIASWTFLESWECFLPWRSEFHRQIILCCDASAFAWGAVLNPNAKSVAIRDYWPSSQSSLGINCKEIRSRLV